MVSVPFVLSKITPLSLGQTTMLLYILFVGIQVVLLKKMTIKIAMQIPFSFAFGILVDYLDVFLNIVPSNIFMSLFYLALAIIITALGAYLMVSMDVILNPCDGIVDTSAKVLKSNFGKMKMIFDCGMVFTSLVISYIFAHTFIGFGIGTFISALTIGRMISFYAKHLDCQLKKFRS